MLTEAGFAELEAFGSLAGEPFRLGSPTLLVVGSRSRAAPVSRLSTMGAI
jgi:hypothetical protein